MLRKFCDLFLNDDSFFYDMTFFISAIFSLELRWQRDRDRYVLTAIISHSDRQLLGNKLSFTLCSIHILFILISSTSFE